MLPGCLGFEIQSLGCVRGFGMVLGHLGVGIQDLGIGMVMEHSEWSQGIWNSGFGKSQGLWAPGIP